MKRIVLAGASAVLVAGALLVGAAVSINASHRWPCSCSGPPRVHVTPTPTFQWGCRPGGMCVDPPVLNVRHS